MKFGIAGLGNHAINRVMPVFREAGHDISEAMEKMRGVDVHQIPALNGRKYMGMLNYREIMRRRN